MPPILLPDGTAGGLVPPAIPSDSASCRTGTHRSPVCGPVLGDPMPRTGACTMRTPTSTVVVVPAFRSSCGVASFRALQPGWTVSVDQRAEGAGPSLPSARDRTSSAGRRAGPARVSRRVGNPSARGRPAIRGGVLLGGRACGTSSKQRAQPASPAKPWTNWTSTPTGGRRAGRRCAEAVILGDSRVPDQGRDVAQPPARVRAARSSAMPVPAAPPAAGPVPTYH